ncbi:MAG TPA: NAD(P)H-dependent oxidoreductase [Ramlibacter sp.]|nr:NAD(P)H-dependent oxidoreductase [Ramlibacter sp.]
MKVLAFAASLREQSLNRKLIAHAADIARSNGAQVDLPEFRAFEVPLFDGDMNERIGLPPGALDLQRRLAQVDALIIAAPEYNYSICGVLKNLIDWVSRARPMPWRGKSIYLMSASPSPMGGIRGLWQTRIPLEGCGALVFPDMFALPHAKEAFDDQGALKDPALEERLQRELIGFLRLADAVAPVVGRPASPAAARRQQQIAVALESETLTQPEPPQRT